MDIQTSKTGTDIQNTGELSLLPLFKILIIKRWRIIGCLLLGIIIGLLLTYLRYTPKYEAEGSVLLQTPEKVKQDAAPSSIFSKNTQSDIVQSSYSTVIDSRNFTEKLVLSQYAYSLGGKSFKSNLVDFYHVNDLDGLINSVNKQLKANYDKKSFVLKFSFISKSPEISAQIVNNAIEQLNDFYQNEFNSTSKRNLEFVKSQIEDAKKSLDDARGKLTRFIKTNKEIKDTKLETNQDRYAYQEAKTKLKELQDDVTIKENFYNSLLTRSQSLGIDASQTAPSIIVLQKAFPPAKPMPPKYVRNGAIIGFLFLVFSIFIIIIRNLGEITGPNENLFTLIIDELKKDVAKLRIKKKC